MLERQRQAPQSHATPSPMTERDTKLFEVLIGQVAKHGGVDVALGKSLRILGHAERGQPIRNLLHRGAPRRNSPRGLTLTVPQQIVLRNCSETLKNYRRTMCLLQKRKFVLSITSRTKAKSSLSSRFSRNGVSHEHMEPESLYLPSVSLVALGPSKTSSSGIAKPGAFTPRVDEPERQDPARYRPHSLRRRLRSVQAVLVTLIHRECQYSRLRQLKLSRYGASHEHDDSEHVSDDYEIRKIGK
jgi:hypothetical protein